MMKASRLAPVGALLVLAASLASLALAGGPAPPAQDPPTGEPKIRLRIETIQVRENLYVLQWPRKKTVTVFVAEEGLVLIDNHFLVEAPGIDSALKAISDQPVRYLINTHWHLDHVASNSWWAEEATIVSHEKARLRMENSDRLGGRKMDPPLEPSALPRVTFEDRLTLHFGGQEIRLVHLPGGHTDGDCIVWFPGLEACVTGDIFYSETVPFIDLDSGGDPWKLIAAVDDLRELLPEDTTLIPGHGNVSKREVLDEYGEMLTAVVERIKVEFERGRTTRDLELGGALVDWELRWGGDKLFAMKNFIRMMDQACHPK